MIARRALFAGLAGLAGLAALPAILACSQAPVPAPPQAQSALPTALSVSASPPPPAPSAEAPKGPEAPSCDLLLKGGKVIDPAGAFAGELDVAIKGGKILRIAPSLAKDNAARVIDARGLLIAPGLVDLHVHVFSGPHKDRYLSRSTLAADVDEAAPRSCTTTVVDAGSAGHRTIADFEAQMKPKKTRALALINIVGHGMRGGKFEQDLGDMDAGLTAAAINAHRSFVVGIKVAHYAGPEWTPIERALEAGKRTSVPVMIDFGGHTPELPLDELLITRLRPGDIYTHLYASVRGRTGVVDGRSVVRPYAKKAAERGVVLDIGHGGASFAFSQAIPAVAQGLSPTTISSDMHRTSLRGSMRDLPNVMSKLMAIGMSASDVIQRATAAPARAIQRPELGRLVEGGEADIAVFALERGDFSFLDVTKREVMGKERLTCKLTVRAGEVIWEAPQ